jgi:hypothetical protein
MRGKKQPKNDQRCKSGSQAAFTFSKNGPCFSGNQKLPGFKKHPKNIQKTDPKKPPKNSNVNHPIVT